MALRVRSSTIWFRAFLKGYSKKLELVGVGYRAALGGKDLEIQLGFSHPVVVEAPENITFEVPSQTEIRSLTASAKSRLARLLQTFANGASPNLVQGQGVFAMKANMYVASLGKAAEV